MEQIHVRARAILKANCIVVLGLAIVFLPVGYDYFCTLGGGTKCKGSTRTSGAYYYHRQAL